MGLEMDNTSRTANGRSVRLSLRHSRRGAVDAAMVGFGLAILGGVMAFIAVAFLLFVPAATIPVIYSETIALVGVVAFGSGWAVHALGSD